MCVVEKKYAAVAYKEALNLAKNELNGIKKSGEHKCAFCRQQAPKNPIKSLKKLMKKNNPGAYLQMAGYYRGGTDGVFQSDTKTLEMLIHAAELDHTEAFLNIGCFYLVGIGVDRDISKGVAFYEVSAKKGSVYAHRELARFYRKDIGKSIKHATIAASAGCQESLDRLMKAYKNKDLSKEELTQTLHAYQASSNEMKSKDRDDACAFAAHREQVEDQMIDR